MIKFVKIVCIGFCFGICNLRSETYNVITVSRDTTAVNYDKLAPDEIRLVFEQLATFIPAEPIKEAKEGDPSTKPPLTIVVFNEAFFGQYEPLSKDDVNEIIETYRSFQSHMGNSRLYINFLYMDTNKKEYEEQIKNSKKRYEEITTEGVKFPSFFVEDEEISTETFKGGPQGGQVLLFNQTKIFYRENEIGYYNKSSFCNEYDKFYDKNLYYVIGNFNTIYNRKEEHQLQIDCLTCYDIDVVSNECYRHYMDGKSIFAFSSNSSSSLPCALYDIYGDLAAKKIFICSDSYEDEVTASIDCKEASEIVAEAIAKGNDEEVQKGMVCLRGVFEYRGSILSPISKIEEISFEYVKAKEYIVKEEENEESAESKDMFSFKKFNLTIN